MQVKSTVAAHHPRQRTSVPSQLTTKRKELSHCLPSKFYARFTHGSHEHTSQLSVETKRVYAYPPLKKRVIYATGHPLQDLRKRYKHSGHDNGKQKNSIPTLETPTSFASVPSSVTPVKVNKTVKTDRFV